MTTTGPLSVQRPVGEPIAIMSPICKYGGLRKYVKIFLLRNVGSFSLACSALPHGIPACAESFLALNHPLPSFLSMSGTSYSLFSASSLWMSAPKRSYRTVPVESKDNVLSSCIGLRITTCDFHSLVLQPRTVPSSLSPQRDLRIHIIHQRVSEYSCAMVSRCRLHIVLQFAQFFFSTYRLFHYNKRQLIFAKILNFRQLTKLYSAKTSKFNNLSLTALKLADFPKNYIKCEKNFNRTGRKYSTYQHE